MHACSLASVTSDSAQPHGLEPARLLCPWDSPSRNTGVGCHALTLGDLPNPGIEPTSLTSPALDGGFFTTSATREAQPSSLKYLNFRLENFVPLTCCILVGLTNDGHVTTLGQSEFSQAWPLPILAVQHILPTGCSRRQGGSLAPVIRSQSHFQFEFSAFVSCVSCCSGSIQSRLFLLQFPTIISVPCRQRFPKRGSLVLGT